MPDSELTTEQWVENLRAAVLDLYRELDVAKGRLDSQYRRIRALEGEPLDTLDPSRDGVDGGP